MSTPPFHCATRVIQNSRFGAVIGEFIAGRRWGLVTSAGWLRRGILRRIPADLPQPAATIADVPENPTWSYLAAAARNIPQIDVLVAVGGGSVLDGAKAFAAMAALHHDTQAMERHLREGAELPASFAPPPIVAVPTTSGTGSEVTRWATVWGEDKIKYSLTHERLYPAAAVLDEELCASMPRRVTLATALDALSHAMEAVWNRRHSALTDALAQSAIATIRRCLGPVLAAAGDLALRREMQSAALLAGLAMGTTQTALAHSISYPFTSLYGVPHGIACSFTLAEVARFNMAQEPERLAPIARGLGVPLAAVPDAIGEWFEQLGIGAVLREYVAADAADRFDDKLITPARAANNMRPVDAAAALALVQRSLKSLLP